MKSKAASLIALAIFILTYIGLTIYTQSLSAPDDIFGSWDFVAEWFILFCVAGEALLWSGIRGLSVFRSAGFAHRCLLWVSAANGLLTIVLSLDFIFRGFFSRNFYHISELVLLVSGFACFALYFLNLSIAHKQPAEAVADGASTQ